METAAIDEGGPELPGHVLRGTCGLPKSNQPAHANIVALIIRIGFLSLLCVCFLFFFFFFFFGGGGGGGGGITVRECF